ncbi:hypothetical protein CVS27_18005 [Arthrobacter glacialis]|uniref:Uncharacterized protein n=1 Tax=Arthrobacter glacialis TaxID=1664 RepID=A0A2S3ZS47_ARTGL|nr:hypothetical protein CVS27_18005 [Arthrobacter glacialis]
MAVKAAHKEIDAEIGDSHTESLRKSVSKRSAVFSRAHGVPSPAASVVAVLAGVALLLNGCALMPDAKAASQETRTTAQGAVLELAGATITVPGTAVATDTAVSASLGRPAAAPQDGGVLRTVSQKLQLTLGAPLADGAAMSVTLTLDPQEYAKGFSPSVDSLALVHQRKDAAEPELMRVAWNPDTKEVNAQVPADGEFWAVHVDVSQVLKTVQSGVEKTAEMAASKPSCVGQQAAAAGMTFDAPSPAGAWICLRESTGKVVVSVSASTSVPLRLATAEQRFGAAVPNPTILNPYFQQVFTPLVKGANARAGAVPGAAVEFELSAAGADQTEWTFQPYPALFLLNYLSIMVAATLESQENLEDFDATTAACVAPLVDTTMEQISLASSWAVPFVEGFMDCVAKTVQISPRMDVILGSLNAVPELVASSAAALWEQGFLGEQARESVTVNIAGTMQWARYSGTLNAAKISFEHPAGWTVMDGSINQQFGQRNSVVVYDHSGSKKAELTVMDSVHAGIAGTLVPVTVLGTVAGGAKLSAPAPFAVQSLAMDLGGKDQLRKSNLWPQNVKLAASISAAAAEPTQRAPGQLTGTVTVETGVKSAVHNTTTRQVSFSHVSNFDDMASAQNYAGGSEFAAIQKMLASFTG